MSQRPSGIPAACAEMDNKLKHIILVGPVYPYKGGISHYTGLMYRALSKKYQVDMVSFKLQYPKLLFKKEQKDYSNDTFKIPETEYLLHTANPFNWQSTAREIRKRKPDLVIFQWWHPYFVPCYWTLCKLLGKSKVMFLCHNVFPHERFPLDRFLTKLVLKQGDCFITQSGTDTEDLLGIKKDADHIQAVHPTYNAFKFEDMDKSKARGLLGLAEEEKVLLFFGFVREYKGLRHLLRALPLLKGKIPGIKLLVVGDFGNDRPEYMELIEQLEVQEMLEIHDGYIPDREVEKYFAASDLVVLPYESATQSGIVQIAYGFEKPVVVTEVGGLPDVVADGKTGYVVRPKDPASLAEAIELYFREEKEDEFRGHIREEAYKYSWDRMVEHVEELCED